MRDSLGSITIFDPTANPAETTTEYSSLGGPRSLDIPETRRLADLISLWHDFDMAVTCLNRLVQLRSSADAGNDGVLERAMWITAVVHYARCFTAGLRQPVLTRDTIRRQLPSDLEFHDWLMELRNKHIAHDESLAWQFEGAVRIWELSDGRRIAQAGASRVVLISADVELATKARDHTLAVGQLLTPRIDVANKRCSEALARMRVDDLLTLPAVQLAVPSALESILSRRPPPTSVKRRRR